MTIHSPPPRSVTVRCRSSADWIVYFENNRQRLRAIPWNEGLALTPAERAAVIRSIQIFQLGESGEGKHFLHVAERYANLHGDHDYLVALKMFLAEEHRHAADLGRVLDLAGEPRLGKEWTDVIFRWLRHRAGLELTVVVLLTGEVIAQVYYAALHRATGSPVLARLCEQILADEGAHVRFQSERLAVLRRGRSRMGRLVTAWFEKFLFAGTCLIVWRGHRPVFLAAGLAFRRFWRLAHTAFRRSLDLRNPRRYVDPEMLSPPIRAAQANDSAVFPKSAPAAGH